MISPDFAPNEFFDDALLSIAILFQPWLWKNHTNLHKVKQKIHELMYTDTAELKDTNKTHNAIFFLSGRAALYYYLKALNLDPESEVLIQAFTCEAVPLPIIANSLKPIYVDIEQETYSMNIEDLRKKITPNSKALILQHTFGIPPKYRREILTLARERNLKVLEDLAHGGHIAKHLDYSSSFLMSFGRSKAVSSVFGGAIVTDDSQISERLEQTIRELTYPDSTFILRCLLYKPLTVLIKATYDWYFGKILHSVITAQKVLIPEITEIEKSGTYDTMFSKAYPNALAILLLHQLKKYQKTLSIRSNAVKHYSDIKPVEKPLSGGLIRFPLLINNRDDILKQAARKNIYLGKWYDQVVAPKKLNLDTVQYKPSSCPVAEEVSKKIINLPTLLTDMEKIQAVINNVT